MKSDTIIGMKRLYLPKLSVMNPFDISKKNIMFVFIEVDYSD